jgi:outer membrane autotransporter protein
MLCLGMLVSAIGVVVPAAARAQLLPFGLPSCPLISLTCTVNTISVLGTTIISRQNQFLLGLDLGLDRQIDILSFPGGQDGIGWAKASTLGGPRDSDPYGLGATKRLAPPSRQAFGVWAEGSFSHFRDDSGPFNSDGQSGVVYLGADYRVSRNILIGALVQFDQAEQDFQGLPSRVSNTGWMAGPYATVRFSDHLFFQARAAWGKAQNEVRPDLVSEDQFDSDRWLVRGTLLGQWQSGPWQFRPRASVGYIEEKKDTYTSSHGMVIPGTTASLGQAKLGPEVVYQFRLAGGTVVETSLLLEGIWNFDQDTGSTKIDDLAVGPKVRARSEVGAMILAADGVSLGASLSYDGIGSGDYRSIGGKVRGRVPFN